MATDTDETTSELAALRAQREALHRELVRKSFRIGELEEAVQDTARIFEESISWKLTRPVRGVRTVLARLKRR
ncbi:MAG TPA: hypothetical protein VGC49_04575 [Solirubrobacterales bacterium]|jgi:hypothetical protein